MKKLLTETELSELEASETGIITLTDYYRARGVDGTGDAAARRLYAKAIRFAKKSYDAFESNYQYMYNYEDVSGLYSALEKMYMAIAVKYNRRAAKCGHDIAMVNYALRLFYNEENGREKAFDLFVAASKAGLATADYALSLYYRHGLGSIAADTETAEKYMSRFNSRRSESLRNRVLSRNVETDGIMISNELARAWLCGFNEPIGGDLPPKTLRAIAEKQKNKQKKKK